METVPQGWTVRGRCVLSKLMLDLCVDISFSERFQRAIIAFGHTTGDAWALMFKILRVLLYCYHSWWGIRIRH